MPTRTSRSTNKIESSVIAGDCPGTIVADFEALMDFVASGVRSTGKYHLLPMARLNELDELMSTPLRPKLQRPQQRSFPHLNGLYLLLRATQNRSSGRSRAKPMGNWYSIRSCVSSGHSSTRPSDIAICWKPGCG